MWFTQLRCKAYTHASYGNRRVLVVTFSSRRGFADIRHSAPPPPPPRRAALLSRWQPSSGSTSASSVSRKKINRAPLPPRHLVKSSLPVRASFRHRSTLRTARVAANPSSYRTSGRLSTSLPPAHATPPPSWARNRALANAPPPRTDHAAPNHRWWSCSRARSAAAPRFCFLWRSYGNRRTTVMQQELRSNKKLLFLQV